ncbi:MAG: hypothetical protein Ct9H300mP1_10890 [Planctomycetaceae bacterium]|nr:MAG: hypothetical protein Ct9H300mP1_10890 [Planctomycetaceae bacterium]
MTRKIATLSVVALVLSIGVLAITGSAAPAKKGADRLLKNVQTKGLKFRQIGRMSFATDGVLLVADRGNGSVVAIDTGDTGSATPLKNRIDNIDTLIAGALGTEATGVQIVDMVVNRINGRIYLSVIRKQDGISALLTIDGFRQGGGRQPGQGPPRANHSAG